MSPKPQTGPSRLAKIISGGQTGVDRGALDAAIALGIAHGGSCPRGRLAEDGRIPDRYAMTELDSSDYAVRTEKNVIDSDATLILSCGRLSGGTELTRRLARKCDKPCLVIDLDRQPKPDKILRWISTSRVEVLNVAGPREGQHPGIAARVTSFLTELLAE